MIEDVNYRPGTLPLLQFALAELFELRDGEVYDAIFSPDGRYLVTAGADGTVGVSLVSMEALMEAARSRLSRGFTHEECRTYLHLAACPKE